MKNKMKFLIKQSFTKKTKTKWFKVINILLAILIIFVFNIDKVIESFGGDFTDVKTIKIVDNVGIANNFESYYEEYINQIGTSSSYEIEQVTNYEEEKEKLIEESSDLIINIDYDEASKITASITSYDEIDLITEQSINSILNSLKTEYTLINSNLTTEELQSIVEPIEVEEITTNPDIENEANQEMIANIIIVVFIVPFFILIILLVQMLGAEINDEKSSRSMEIIVSSVSPKVHFSAKIIGAMSFVLFQCFLFFLYGIIGLAVRYFTSGGLGLSEASAMTSGLSEVITSLQSSGVISSILSALPFILILLFVNLLAFALLAGILASMTTNLEDYQQVQSPLMIICLISYYLAFMITFFDGSIFIKIVSYLPFFSTMIAPVLYVLGESSIYELLISITVTLFTCFLLFKYGLRIYKVGILNYSSKNIWKKIFKSVKQK